jgi:hypothetical protein
MIAAASPASKMAQVSYWVSEIQAPMSFAPFGPTSNIHPIVETSV